MLSMLAEAGDAEPPTGERFRKIVSVRKLRARLGAGDPATLARMLNAIEAEVVRAGLADLAMPGIPVEIAEQSRARRMALDLDAGEWIREHVALLDQPAEQRRQDIQCVRCRGG